MLADCSCYLELSRFAHALLLLGMLADCSCYLESGREPGLPTIASGDASGLSVFPCRQDVDCGRQGSPVNEKNILQLSTKCTWISSNTQSGQFLNEKNYQEPLNKWSFLHLLDWTRIFQIGSGGQAIFFMKSANRKSANSWAHSSIAINKFLTCASPQIANPQILS